MWQKQYLNDCQQKTNIAVLIFGYIFYGAQTEIHAQMHLSYSSAAAASLPHYYNCQPHMELLSCPWGKGFRKRTDGTKPEDLATERW